MTAWGYTMLLHHLQLSFDAVSFALTLLVGGYLLAGLATDAAGSHRAIFAFAAFCALCGWVLVQGVKIVRPEPEGV